MLECEKCGRRQDGRGPIICPACGYIMFPVEETEREKLDEENIEDGRDL